MSLIVFVYGSKSGAKKFEFFCRFLFLCRFLLSFVVSRSLIRKRPMITGIQRLILMIPRQTDERSSHSAPTDREELNETKRTKKKNEVAGKKFRLPIGLIGHERTDEERSSGCHSLGDTM